MSKRAPRGQGGLRHPIFRPLWRRVALTAACIGWAALEASWGNPGWFWVFFLIGLYAAYEFFLVFDPRDYSDDEDV